LLPDDQQPPESPNKTWAKYPFDDSSNLWVDTSHDEALHWYAQIINREKNAIDYGQTFARRNALKHLLGIQKAPGPVWDLAVLCWRPVEGSIIKWDSSKYLVDLRGKVSTIIQGSKGFVDNQPAALTMGKEDLGEQITIIDHETGELDIDEGQEHPPLSDFMDTSPTPPPEPAPEPAPEPPPKKHPQGRKPAEQKKTAPPPSEPPLEEQRETASMTKSFMVAKTNFPTEFHAALKQLGLTEPVAPGSYIKVLDVINRILDENM
jgi:hypothetical protein